MGSEISGQTVLYSDPAGQSHTNTDGPVLDVTPEVDISNCTSIEFTIDYSFPAGWEGGGNLEYLDECCMDCDGDPENPTQLGCLQNMTCSGMVGCWDFMWIRFMVDGNAITENLIGDEGTTDAESSGTFSFIYCVTEEENAHIEITNQNWAAAETNIYSNVSILCWEGQPTIEPLNSACSSSTLDLIGDALDPSVVNSWEWTTDGSAIINDDASQITFASGAMDGDEFTLTTTDVNDCQGVETAEVVINNFDVTLQGGGDLCEGECTDDDSDLIIEISGGEPLYELSFTVNGIAVPFAPATDVDAVIRICNDPDAIVPEYDEDTNPPQLIVPSFLFPIVVELIDVVDANGCMGNILGGSVAYDIVPPPDINPTESPFYCVDEPGLIDLTLMDDDIDPNDFDVLWFEDSDLEDQINNPSQYDISNGTTVWAVVDDGECFSEAIEIMLDINFLPLIDVIQSPLSGCFSGDFILPPLEDVVNITNPNNPGYYLDAEGIDGPYTSINAEEVDEIYIFDSAGPDCSTSVVIPLNLFEAPDVESPIDGLAGCGSLILPFPEGNNIDDFQYNLEEDGTGFSFDAGDIINSADNISELFLIALSNNGCEVVIEVDITLESDINYIVNIPSQLCDSLVLPSILPSTGGEAYYTASMGMGIQLIAGDVIYAPFNGDLYIFDTSLDANCASEDTININFGLGLEPIFPSDTMACEFIVLPEFGGVTGPNIRYAQFPITDLNSSYYPGDTLAFSQILFVLDTIGSCEFFDSMTVVIVKEPFAGSDTTLIICEGFESSNFDFMSLLSNPDTGGEWNYPVVPDFMPFDSTMIDLDVFPIGNFNFQYTIEDSICGIYTSEISLQVIEPPYGGENNNISLCQGVNNLNFMELVSSPDTGGAWEQVLGPEPVVFADSSSVDLSGLINGLYGFLYVIEGEAITEYCEPESSSLFITIGSGVNAGSDTLTTACQGEIVELTNLLSGDADSNGFFEGNNIVFSGTSWNTSASIPNLTYDIRYIILSNDQSCPGDTAKISIYLVEQLSAGNAITPAIACEGDLVDLNNFIINASGPGVFITQADPSAEIINGLWTGNTTEDFYFIIEGTESCDSDTLSFSVEIINRPSYNVVFSGNELCSGNENLAIDLNIIPLGSNTNIFEFYLFNNLDNSLIYQADSTSQNTINLKVISSTNGPLLSNDTLFINAMPGEYRMQILAFDDSGLCQDDQNVEVVIEVFESFIVNIDAQICEEESFEYDGVFYTSSQVLNFPGGTAGCDSIININISNYPQEVGTFSGVFCTGDTIQILGQSYFENIQILETFSGESSFGCDSLIMIDLIFESTVITNISEELCEGEEIEINNTIYNFSNPSGMDTLISIMGCDSIILINVSFLSSQESDFQIQICSDESITIGTDIYDIDNLSGVSILENAASNGCDSIVNIDLELYSEAVFTLLNEICPGDSIQVGGVSYDENNLTGTSILPNVASNGCDSIVNVTLTLLSPAVNNLTGNICESENLLVGSDIYDINNLIGTTVLSGAALNGCDSIVNVELTVQVPPVFSLNQSICPGEEIIIGGDIYDQDNLSGSTTLPNQSVFGCDSIVNVNLQLTLSMAEIITTSLCPEDSEGLVIINETENLEYPIDISVNNNFIGSYDSSPIELMLPPGMLNISILDANSCTYEELVSLDVLADLGLDLMVKEISENLYELSYVNNFEETSIEWVIDFGGTIQNEESIGVEITEDTQVNLVLISAEGCQISTSVLLQYIRPVEEFNFYIPNVFDISDPGNNTFTVLGNNLVITDMSIYDRWGNLVYFNDGSDGKEFTWDGRMNERLLEQGVYIYKITVLDNTSNPQTIVGDITLIR